MKNQFLKLGIILTASIFTLTACGQKGELYLPKENTSELPTITQSDNPTDLTNIQNPKTTDPSIDPANQNPNITLQDSKHDY